MKRLMLGIMAALMLTAPMAAAEELLVVADPTEDQSLSGEYPTGKPDDPQTTDVDESKGYQQGYVAVYDDGAVVCNGNPRLVDNDFLAERLVGYVYVGSAHKPTTTTLEVQGEAGHGTNGPAYGSGVPSGESPCEEADPQGINE